MISVYVIPQFQCTKCLSYVGINLEPKEGGGVRAFIVHPPSSGFICPDENQIIPIGDPDITEMTYGG
jgi:hypothetical protein